MCTYLKTTVNCAFDVSTFTRSYTETDVLICKGS